MNRNRSRGAARPTSYQIVVRGELSQRFSMAFEGMALVAGDGQTAITGPVVDQAHLHGLLDRVRDLGLELVSVNATLERTPPSAGRGEAEPARWLPQGARPGPHAGRG
jgi:hypothetical protein